MNKSKQKHTQIGGVLLNTKGSHKAYTTTTITTGPCLIVTFNFLCVQDHPAKLSNSLQVDKWKQ